jgi:hypothetical protein
MARATNAASAQAQSAPVSPFADELAQILTVLTDESLTAKGAAKTAAQHFAAMDFPEVRRFQVKDLLVKLSREVATLIANDDSVAIRPVTGKLFIAARELAQPIPVAKIPDIVKSLHPFLQELGYGSGAI